jgi:flagellar biogenesis protein FliO
LEVDMLTLLIIILLIVVVAFFVVPRLRGRGRGRL